jgi:hypothetical protein
LIKVIPILIFCLLSACLFGQDNNQSLTDEELREMIFGEGFAPQIKEEIKPNQTWIPSYSGKNGIGYSDNPLYGPFIREDAAYYDSSLEAFFLRDGNPEQFTYAYLFGEGKLFEELPEHESTLILLGQFEHAYTPENSSQTYGIRLRHTYYDQGFDFSDLGLPYSMQIRSHKSECIPYLSQRFSELLTATIELAKGQENFKEVTDDNKEQGVTFSIKGSPNVVDWKLESEIINKEYKERPKRNWDGSLMSNDSLETRKVMISIELEKDFENIIVSYSKAKFFWSCLKDNAGGYYDYDKVGMKLEHNFDLDPYNLDLEIGGAKTTYDLRRLVSGERFERESFTCSALFQRPLGDKLDAYFKWSREEDFSNLRDYEYYTNSWSAGISWEL